jgi:hypothetical protein
MKPPLPRIQSAVPQMLHVQLEIAKAIRTLVGHDEDDAQRRTEIAAIRRDCEALKRDLQKVGEEWLTLVKAKLRMELKKYNPDQPRVPAGNTDGGQWTSGEIGISDDLRLRTNSHNTSQILQTSNTDGSFDGTYDPRVLSDITPDNTWIPGARYAIGWEHHYVPWATFQKYTL